VHIEANGIRLHVTIRGDGPPLLLSHSLGCDSHMWDAQIDRLATRFRVIAVDTRGHGASDAPPGPYTMAQLADDFDALLDALHIDTCRWMGLSMGGMIGMTHAVTRPGRLSHLILCNTSARLGPAAQPIWAQRIATVEQHGMAPLVAPTLERWFTAPFRAEAPEVVARIGEAVAATPPQGYVGCCHAIAAIDVLDALPAVKVPTLVIAGDHDVGTPLEMSRAIQQAIPGAQLACLPQAAHLSNLERPRHFDLAVEMFLAST
jgi:3-oxoadipate enol-lactonase